METKLKNEKPKLRTFLSSLHEILSLASPQIIPYYYCQNTLLDTHYIIILFLLKHIIVANTYYYSLTTIKHIALAPLPSCYCTSTPHIVLLLMLHIKSKIGMLLGSYYFIFLLFLGLLKSSYFPPLFLGDLFVIM